MASLPFLSLCCTFLILFAPFCVYISSRTVLAFPDEYLPKRLDIQSQDTIMMDLSDDPESIPHVNSTKPRSYLPSVFQCSILCYLEPPTHEMIQCTKPSNHGEMEIEEKPEKPVSCQEFRNRREIVIGQKESVRGISPGALENLIGPNDDWSSTAGQLSVHLNLNMVRLDSSTFVGLEMLVTEVRLLNTVQMHPDTFIDLRHLRVFEIDSGLTPVPLMQDDQSAESNTANQADAPMFLRFRPADKTVPISFNLETECHQCIPDTNETLSTDSDIVVVVFKRTRSAQQQQQSSKTNQPQFSMLFPQICPKLSRALGCSPDGNLSNYLTVPFTADKLKLTESVSLADLRNAGIIVTETKTPSLLILLSIWCSVLTLVIVIIVCVVYFCTKRFNSHRRVPKWFPTSCFTLHSSSPEDLSSNSTNSGFFNKQADLPQSEKGVIFTGGMSESQTSWNSLRAKPSRSTSSHSLRDKSLRTLRHSRMSIDRSRLGGPARRSIGSQTDFTDMDSDAAVYSSLRRPCSYVREYFGQEPPMRTSSQYALSRMRYTNRLENGIHAHPERPFRYASQTRYTDQSNHTLPYTTTTTTAAATQRELDDPLDADMNELGQEAFIPMDSEVAIQPHGLPPIYPGSKPGSQSPAPWRKHLQSGLSLDV